MPNDFAHTCAMIILEAKRQAAITGRPFLLSEVAAIIRGHCRDKPKPKVREAKPAPAAVDSSPFGDRHVIPPPPEHVAAYSASIGWPLDGDAFCDFYERKGWLVGRTKMKDWQAACRYAKREQFTFGGPKKAEHASANEDYTAI